MSFRTRKARIVLALGAIVCLSAAGWFVFAPRPSRITEENWRRIRIGMSIQDVVAILGPPGDSRTGPTAYVSSGSEVIMRPPHDKKIFDKPLMRPPDLQWHGDSGTIWVWLDHDEVYFDGFTPTRPPQYSLWEWLRWRVERLSQRWFP
jgi:hypothetical protein